MFHTVFFYFDLLLCFVLLFLLRPVAVLLEYVIVFRSVILTFTYYFHFDLLLCFLLLFLLRPVIVYWNMLLCFVLLFLF